PPRFRRRRVLRGRCPRRARRRRTRRRRTHVAVRLRRRVVATVVTVVLLLIAAWGLDRTRRTVDLTAERSLTLTAQTRRLVRQVHHRLRVVAFFDREDPQRVTAATLLLRYQRLNRRIRVRLVE